MGGSAPAEKRASINTRKSLGNVERKFKPDGGDRAKVPHHESKRRFERKATHGLRQVCERDAQDEGGTK